MINQNIKNKISTPILSYFKVEGLNGYKNIKITLERNIKIISTENGAGKTTLLNMLYSLLSGKANRLQRIDFKKFTLKINKKDITYSKKQLFPQPIDSEKIRFPFPAGRFIYDALSKEDIHELLNLYATDYNANFWKHKNIQKLLSDTPLEINDIREIFDERINSICESSEDLLKLKKEIKENLNEITILYLPTYRRIEADLSEFDNSIFIERNRRYHNFRRAQAENIESEQLIYFGLEDVEKRLNNITKEIRDATFEAYSRINARHLDQLVNIGIKNNHKK